MANDFSKEVRDAWKQAEDADRLNREEAIRDLKFAAGEHWDDQVRQYREQLGIQKYGFPLPCLTINNIPAIVAQVTGDRMANETAIKVLANEESDKVSADVRSEIIRSIEVRSKAQRVYRQTFQGMVNCGISNFRIDLDYAYDDVFERDLFVRGIPNPLAVLWDPMSADPTGKDAGYCFVAEDITRDEFKKRFGSSAKDAGVTLDAPGLRTEGWEQPDAVRIAEYWTMTEKPRTIAMLLNPIGGDPVIEDVTDLPEKEWAPRLVKNGDKPMLRKAPRKYARMVVTNGREELSDPFELPLCRLPIIRVNGQEVWEGNKRTRFGLVRFARDPARLKDYMRSIIAEKLMLSSRANFFGPASAFKGREKDFPNVLVYNDGAAAEPKEITGNNLPAMVNEAQWYAEDLKDVTGIFDASRGMKSNETSGVAIARRQQEGDIATMTYHSNMDDAQMEGGEVLNSLLGLAYDTARTVRLIGANEAVKFLRVNDPLDPDSVDLSKGRYDVTISTGPAYMTRRVEAAAQLTDLASRSPKLIDIAGDKIIQALDIPDGDEIAERVKRSIPPQILGDEADDDASPEELQAKQEQADQAQQMQQMGVALEMQQKQAVTRKANAEADRAEAEALKAKTEAMQLLGGEAPDPAVEAVGVLGLLPGVADFLAEVVSH
jgi:hypothetical protein